MKKILFLLLIVSCTPVVQVNTYTPITTYGDAITEFLKVKDLTSPSLTRFSISQTGTLSDLVGTDGLSYPNIKIDTVAITGFNSALNATTGQEMNTVSPTMALLKIDTHNYSWSFSDVSYLKFVPSNIHQSMLDIKNKLICYLYLSAPPAFERDHIDTLAIPMTNIYSSDIHVTLKYDVEDDFSLIKRDVDTNNKVTYSISKTATYVIPVGESINIYPIYLGGVNHTIDIQNTPTNYTLLIDNNLDTLSLQTGTLPTFIWHYNNSVTSLPSCKPFMYFKESFGVFAGYTYYLDNAFLVNVDSLTDPKIFYYIFSSKEKASILAYYSINPLLVSSNTLKATISDAGGSVLEIKSIPCTFTIKTGGL